METRKVQLVGGSIHTDSLPRGWAREHDVRAGAFLHLHPLADGSLLLGIDGEKDGETVEDERSDRTISDSREPRSPLSNCGNPSADSDDIADPAGLAGKRGVRIDDL
jgi:hypothetical protein